MADSFLNQLARAGPAPGGAAAAAYGAALGLALLEKVVRLEANRPQAEPQQRSWEKTLPRLQDLAQALGRLQEEDVQAYFNPVRTRLAGNAAELSAALQEAVRCPLRIVQRA